MLLVEFPYPSGDLHIGHWYTFAVSDILARYLRMKGEYEIMYPIGFDAFGLPAENAAIKHGTTPANWTETNVERMTQQLKNMHASFDWDRLVNTSHPDYYRWTQWIFLKLFEQKLAYRASTIVNWCPKDKTVLANEQVTDGCCERCDSPVEQRELEQWMFKTTAFADALADDLEDLDWTETIKSAQRNWIGRSTGALIKWPLRVPGIKDEENILETFTTRADTLFGATFLVISPELGKKWLSTGWDAPNHVRAYIEEALGKRELDRLEGGKEKTGVDSGASAVHPLTGETVPVWVADYVLGSYGTGAIMAVPAHDQRDYEFANKFNIPVTCVIDPPESLVAQLGDTLSDAQRQTQNQRESILAGKAVYEGDGNLINSEAFNGLNAKDAVKSITKALKEKGMGRSETQYKLRDWVLSRQRYWGCPIPMIKCPSCGYVPVSKDDLPVKLPALEDFKPANDGRSPLAKAGDWLKVKCPTCGEPAERETDTMDTFVDSSWYFLRYADPKNAKKFADPKHLKEWMPVPLYIGGPEHNTMHLLYARFITKALHAGGHLSFNEPFTTRRNHSVILGADGNRMSKSRGNVVDPDHEVKTYGADTVRMYLAFMGPYSDQTMPWDPNGITGVHRFLKRVRALYEKEPVSEEDPDVERALHAATKKVSADIPELKYNTAISELMKTLNLIEEHNSGLTKKQRGRFLAIVAPFAPELSEELQKGIHDESWPEYDENILKTSTVEIPVQVNGILRGHITLAPDAGEAEAVFAAKQDAGVERYLAEGEPRKVIYKPGKLLNLVV
ncbi:MAG TPA: leucine--tRNA ligase [Candidatus Paceibacterota bacterium]|nr:leucine--tRNA ligase [Candidatus Paceibacterota bacterium]